ncbi:MAG: hypothetical protein QXL47_04040 [Candidatus Anstonellales archaeon]
MRVGVVALILAAILLTGCIQVGQNCKGKAECYKKAAVYYALMGDKKEALQWCRKITDDPDISITVRHMEYNNCVIEVARTFLDKNLCSETHEHFWIPHGWPVSNVKEFCEKMVEQEELRQQAMLDRSQAYKHTCPSAMLVFSIVAASLFMRIYEK